jgi:hypothetical protein
MLLTSDNNAWNVLVAQPRKSASGPAEIYGAIARGDETAHCKSQLMHSIFVEEPSRTRGPEQVTRFSGISQSQTCGPRRKLRVPLSSERRQTPGFEVVLAEPIFDLGRR